MDAQKQLSPQPLTRENFAAFGDVIEVNPEAEHFTINDGFTERYHDLAKVDVNQQNGKTLISIFRSKPLPLPITIKAMERHPLSSQAIIPMSNCHYLVVVAAAGVFEPLAIRAFLAGPHQGVNYHPGTWHHYCIALQEVSDFVVVDRGGKGDNCDVINLDDERIIVLP